MLAFGLYCAALCLVKGLNQTNMDNRFAFGLWIFLDLTVIALGAGAFFTGFLLYILKLRDLRAVINSACTDSVITFNMNQVISPITLTSGDFLLFKNLTFQGPGANVLTIQRSAAAGTPLFSIFSIYEQSVTTVISGLTLSNADSSINGGAIMNQGTLTVNNVTLSNNHSASGGAAIINTSTGNTTITNSTISGNQSGSVGAIFNAHGAMTISISNARTNEALGPGSASAHLGLEHFAIESADIDADIARLKDLGAHHQEGPILAPNGVRFAFLAVPDDVRIELVQPPKPAA